MTSTKQKRLQDALRREIDRGVQIAAKQKPPTIFGGSRNRGKNEAERQHLLALGLADSLRNVKRTATRALDEAGVPDRLQGGDEADWDSDDHEEWGY